MVLQNHVARELFVVVFRFFWGGGWSVVIVFSFGVCCCFLLVVFVVVVVVVLVLVFVLVIVVLVVVFKHYRWPFLNRFRFWLSNKYPSTWSTSQIDSLETHLSNLQNPCIRLYICSKGSLS